jgi:DNA-binding NarL/FixJ family response regulator
MKRIRVLLADDHAILRDSMKAFLGLHAEVEVVGEAGDGLQAIAEALRLEPDVLLLDIGMPNLGGLEVTHRLKRDLPSCKILILSQHHAADYVLPILKAGADGYVLKKSGGNEVVRAIKSVASGDAYLHPAIAQTVLQTSVRGEEAQEDPLSIITVREREVLAIIGEGKTNQQIASALSISLKTVDKHRANLMKKLGVSSRAALIRFALDHKPHAEGNEP